MTSLPLRYEDIVSQGSIDARIDGVDITLTPHHLVSYGVMMFRQGYGDAKDRTPYSNGEINPEIFGKVLPIAYSLREEKRQVRLDDNESVMITEQAICVYQLKKAL